MSRRRPQHEVVISGLAARLARAEDDIRILKLMQRLRPWTNSQWPETARRQAEAHRNALVGLWPRIPAQRTAPAAERRPTESRTGRKP